MLKSPFPGMDPYLEQDWLDVHQRLITYICDQLQDQLPADLVARMEERVILEDDAGLAAQSRHPDVSIIEDVARPRDTVSAVAIASADPNRIVVSVGAEPATESYIVIVDAKNRSRVVCCIELLSPTNKRPGAGRELYLQKQAECLAAKVNLVEIDLTRSGNRDEVLRWFKSGTSAPTYVAGVRRSTNMHRVEVHDFPLDKPLKPIRIPLRPADEDAILQLQPLVEQAYDRGRYDTLDYRRPLDPPLTGAEAEFAKAVLQAAGKA